MGNACGGTTGRRLPSSLQLCREFDRAYSQNAAASWPACGIFEWCNADELDAIGGTIEAWAQGRTPGVEAKRLLQAIASTSACPSLSSVIRLTSRDTAVSTDWLANSPTPSATSRCRFGSFNGCQCLHCGQQQAVRIQSRRSPSRHRLAEVARARAQPGEDPQPQLHMFPPRMVVALTATGTVFSSLMLLGEASSSASMHSFLNFMDDVLVHSGSSAESWSMAMREVGLDGPRPVLVDVKVRFRELVEDILRTNGSLRREGSERLDLLKVCVCMEVLRHISPPPNGPVALPEARPRRADSSGSNSSGTNTSSDDVRHRGTVTVLSRVSLPMTTLSGWPASQELPIGPVSRLDYSLLHLRTLILLREYMQHLPENTERRIPRAMGPEDLDRLCPMITADGSGLQQCDVCCICLETMTSGEPLRRLPCQHVLHKECCESWLSRADTCPSCRRSIHLGEDL